MRFNLLVYVSSRSMHLFSLTNRSLTLELVTGMRSNIIKHHFQDQASPQDRAYVSAFCGGLSGGVVTRLMGTIIDSIVLYLAFENLLMILARRSTGAWIGDFYSARLRRPKCF